MLSATLSSGARSSNVELFLEEGFTIVRMNGHVNQRPRHDRRHASPYLLRKITGNELHLLGDSKRHETCSTLNVFRVKKIVSPIPTPYATLPVFEGCDTASCGIPLARYSLTPTTPVQSLTTSMVEKRQNSMNMKRKRLKVCYRCGISTYKPVGIQAIAFSGCFVVWSAGSQFND